jgi:glycoside/pentoside/hexuronide:cation symporter, GPH family
MSASEHTLSRKTVATYAIGSLGTGGFATLPGLVLVYYLTDNLGLAAILSGVVVTVAKVWDVFIDPLIGAWSDRSLRLHGTRRRFMVLGGLLLPVFFIVTFAVPIGLPNWASAIWVFLAFVLTATAFSLFQVPYIALPAELTDGYDQRTRLLAMRVVVLTFAILLFGAGGPALRSLGGDNHYLGYLLMAIVAGVVIGVGMLVSSRVAPVGSPAAAQSAAAATSAPAQTGSGGYRAGFAALRRSQPFRAIVLSFLLQALATGLMLAGAQYVATYVLKSEDAVTYLFVALIAPAIVFAPVWAAIARRIGKERGFLIASILFGIAALAMVGLLWAPGAWVYLPVALAGAGYAGMQSLPMSMLPDVISHDARTNGPGLAGAFGGIWTAGETTGMALGATALTVILSVSGYVSSVADQHAAQSPAAIAGIVLSFSVVPAVFIGASLIALTRYRLRRDDIESSATPNEPEAASEVVA